MNEKSEQHYQVFFRGKLAQTKSVFGPLTYFRAKMLKKQLMEEKGWMASEIEIVPVAPENTKEGDN